VFISLPVSMNPNFLYRLIALILFSPTFKVRFVYFFKLSIKDNVSLNNKEAYPLF